MYKDPTKQREAVYKAIRKYKAKQRQQKKDPTGIIRWRENPVAFLNEVFGVECWQKQVEILEALRDYERVTVRSGNSAGKSFVAAGAILWFLLCHYPSTVLSTAPTYRQVRDILWRELATMYTKAKCPVGGDLWLPTTRLNLENDWFAIGLSSDEPDKFQGYHNENILIVVDEPSGVNEQIFEAVEGIIAGGKAKLLLVGNPMSLSGTYWGSFNDEMTAQNYKQIQIGAFDTPNFTKNGITPENVTSWKDKINGQGLPMPYLVTPKWVAEKLAEWGQDNPLYQIRVLGEFPVQGIDTLIPLNLITQAVSRESKAEGVKVLAVDVARYGDDETVAGIRQGSKLLKMWRWSKQDTMQTTNRLVNIIKTESPSEVRVDVIGLGAGVVDRLKEMQIKVKGINVAEAAAESGKYVNLRAEIFWHLREKFQNGNIDLPDDSKMVAQLAGLKYEFDANGKLKLQSKEDMRRKGLKSPDIADMIAMAYWDKTKRGFSWAWA